MSDVVVVNEKDEVVGFMERKLAHRTGTPHRVSVIYVANPEGKILVQVRVSGRLEHSSVGHVDPGEEYLETAKRELEEELGIAGVELEYVGHGISEQIEPEKGEHRVHVMEIYSCIAEPVALQPEEIREVFWADPREVLADMQATPEGMKFTAGFRVSLPIYLAAVSKK